MRAPLGLWIRRADPLDAADESPDRRPIPRTHRTRDRWSNMKRAFSKFAW